MKTGSEVPKVVLLCGYLLGALCVVALLRPDKALAASTELPGAVRNPTIGNNDSNGFCSNGAPAGPALLVASIAKGLAIERADQLKWGTFVNTELTDEGRI